MVVYFSITIYNFCGGFGKGLKRIVLPKHLHYLGEDAFYGCDKLEKMNIRGDFMWQPSWLKNNPFSYIKSLVDIKNSNPNFKVEKGMLMSSDSKILFRCVNEGKRVVVKDGVETIAQGAFCGRNRIEEVILPTSLKKYVLRRLVVANSLIMLCFLKGLNILDLNLLVFVKVLRQ